MTTISSRVSVSNLRRMSSRKVQTKWFTVSAKLFRYPKRKWLVFFFVLPLSSLQQATGILSPNPSFVVGHVLLLCLIECI